MNNRPEHAPTDYIGLLGKDPKSDEQTAIAWREMRDMVVHGPRQFAFASKPRLWPWQWSSKRWGSSGGTIGANLPKGGGKTEVMRRMWETGEQMGMHGYMNYPGMLDDVVSVSPGGMFEAFEPKEHQRESLAEIAKRFADNLPEYKGHRKNGVPILTGLHSLNTMLNGGIPLRSWYNQPMHVPMEIRAKTNRNWPIQAMGSELLLEAYAKAYAKHMEGRVFIDLEADMDLEGTLERMKRHVDGFVVDSCVPKKRSASPYHFALDYKMGDMQYLYNPTDRLTQLYEKARKKFKHKDAVNYLVKREKSGRKWVARQLEEIGAAYEKKERAELREKVRAKEDAEWKAKYGDFM